MSRRKRPTRAQLGSSFETRRSTYAAIDVEGPPPPPDLEEAQVRAWYAEQGMPYDDDTH